MNEVWDSRVFHPRRLTEMRHMRSLSTHELAALLNERNQDVSEVQVRTWEQGSVVPDKEQQVQLGWILDCPVKRWSMPDGGVRIGFTTLAFHAKDWEETRCVECGDSGEFLCDQRGDEGQFICSKPLCVVHARSINGDDYCVVHVGFHDMAYTFAERTDS